MEWTNAKYLNFINDYKKCRVLWDIRNPNYKKNGKKRKILNVLGQKYGMDQECVRKKIKNLRSAFHREHHRLSNKNKGEEDEDDDVKKWFAYDALKFILDVTAPYTNKGEELSNSVEDSFHKDEYEDDDDAFDINTQYLELPQSIDKQPERSTSPETKHSSQKSVNVNKEEDEYDLFGRSMTMQLRKLPELVALDLMQKMQLMVFNAKKQLSKGKNKAQLKIKKQVSQPTSKKKIRTSSPMSHMSSPSSTHVHKFEAVSPKTSGVEDNDQSDFYEYIIGIEDDESCIEETNEDYSRNKISKRQSTQNGEKSTDPLEVKRVKNE